MEELIRMEAIEKNFPGVHALQQARFDLRGGEVHAVVGENGAGKSTLMKVLTGIYPKDGGKVFFKGEEVSIADARQAQLMGISMIHQELNLMQHLTVAENIFIGREFKKGLLLDDKKAREESRKLLESLHIAIDPAVKAGHLSVAQQQMVEIAKALSFQSQVVIMDEPTAALTNAEIDELFRFITDLRAKGVGIVYISHRLDELKRITDRITVMRDGQTVSTLETKDATIEEIIRLMVGRVIYEPPKSKSNVPEGAPVVLEAKNLASSIVKGVSFTLRRGEILGFAGLMGAGRTETMRLLFGADPLTGGEVYVNGKRVHIASPSDAVNHGIAYLSEDRKKFGLALGLSVSQNAVLSSLENYTKAGFVDERAIGKVTQQYIDAIDIKTPSMTQLVKNLSGGNQQKVVLAKWLIRNCQIIIFDEPTRGIDVGAKSEIYKLMNRLVAEGKSIIMISSELEELLRMSDRVLVMCEGRLTGEVDIGEATQENIMTYAVQRAMGGDAE